MLLNHTLYLTIKIMNFVINLFTVTFTRFYKIVQYIENILSLLNYFY